MALLHKCYTHDQTQNDILLINRYGFETTERYSLDDA